MSPNYKAKKTCKKQRRCLAIIENDIDSKSSEEPTAILGILNAGLATGLTEEQILQSALPHGAVQQVQMLPNKSYCFFVCESETDAANIFNAMHGKAKIGQKDTVVYLSYFNALPKESQNSQTRQDLPEGLVIIEDFVSPDEEQMLLRSIEGAGESATEIEIRRELKHRRVKHFGFEFLYGVNNVDPDKPLAQGIPNECNMLWSRLAQMATEKGLTLAWQKPDQMTVNYYEPGQGIPPHVDTHSAFLDPIVSLSLESDLVMEFRRGEDRVPVLLKRYSLLIMSGESRYDWTHGITPRMLDVVQSPSGALTTQARSKRTSMTFRRLRKGPCDCAYPTLCDSRLQAKSEQPSPTIDPQVAVRLEEDNVHRIYDEIAQHFSETRHTPWPQVAAFLNEFSAGSIVLDIGCGNGKYLKCNPEILTIGCDRSTGLLAVCSAGGSNVFRCDCLQVPIRSDCVDGCISIAVIHHLATFERRVATVREMARILRKGGRALIYVWAKDQRANDKKSSYLLQNKAINRHKRTQEQQRQMTARQLPQQEIDSAAAIDLPIHTNRTEFLQQDVLVPWKLKGPMSQKPSTTECGEKPATFLRYYHVFEQDELERLVREVPNVEVVRSYYDQGNHCVIFEKQ